MYFIMDVKRKHVGRDVCYADAMLAKSNGCGTKRGVGLTNISSK
jgi:hypothetical protein